MKLIPESLEESLKFQRSQDPKKSMEIGIKPKIFRMLSYLHMELRDAAREYFGSSSRDLEAADLKWILWQVYYEGKSFQEAFDILKEKTYRSSGEKDLVKDFVEKEFKIKINESIEFQRGIDPKAAMGIGDAAILPGLIDSNTLEAISMFDSYSKEEYKENFDTEDDPETRNYEFVKRAKRFLKDKVTFGKFFDWKEQDQMEEYIQKFARGRYVYNAYPGGDGWAVVFSKIHLPRAEEIDV